MYAIGVHHTFAQFARPAPHVYTFLTLVGSGQRFQKPKLIGRQKKAQKKENTKECMRHKNKKALKLRKEILQ